MKTMIHEENKLPALRAFPKKLRVLHIGNIANNAYLNAKILNEAGFDCDVLSNSYYHIMGSPEWEDADFSGETGSEFFPNWNKVNLRGFHRPRWFAQGPLKVCLYYLNARRQKRRLRAQVGWFLLEVTQFLARYPRLSLYLAKLSWKMTSLRKLGLRVLTKVLDRNLGMNSSSLSSLTGNPSDKSDLNRNSVSDFDTSLKGKFLRYLTGAFTENGHYRELSMKFLQNFPDRADQFLEKDIELYLNINYHCRAKLLDGLFRQYDVIHTYGIDSILAFLSGVHPYIAFEHGTIRSIPFEENPQGQLTALSYRMADGVIITNCDNKRAAERLDLMDFRFIPHPINEESIQPGIGESLREGLHQELKADFIIFHPSRQHWDTERHPSWEKGNDILIEGMARFVQETGINLGAIFVEWGQKIAESKALIARLGIQNNIKWIPPLHSANMARYIDACDLLADQFFLGAFGSTMPRALALGKPAMIYLDEEIHRWCFPEMPPIINARTPDQVYEGVRHAIEDPNWLANLARDGQHWYQKYHSNAVIRDRLMSYYEDVLNKHQRQI